MSYTLAVQHPNSQNSLAIISNEPPPGWQLELGDTKYLRDEVEHMSDEQVSDLITRLRKYNKSWYGEHVYIPTVLENILLKRRLAAVEADVATLKRDILQLQTKI